MSAARPPEGASAPWGGSEVHAVTSVGARMSAVNVADWDAARLASWSDPHLARVEAALSRWVGVDAPVLLGDAMRYAVLDGGKRLRPLLVLAASEARQCGRGAARSLRNRADPRLFAGAR